MSTDDLRASDHDRDRTAEIVRQAASEGRLDPEEMEQRLEQVFAARTYGDLTRITRDLPNALAGAPGEERPTHVPDPAPDEVAAIFRTERWRGEWLVPPRMRLRAIFGEIELNVTEATLPHEVSLEVQVIGGRLTLYVPDDVSVAFEPGVNVLGSRENRITTEPRPGTPAIRVSGSVVLGEVEARRPKRWFGFLRRR